MDDASQTEVGTASDGRRPARAAERHDVVADASDGASLDLEGVIHLLERKIERLQVALELLEQIGHSARAADIAWHREQIDLRVHALDVLRGRRQARHAGGSGSQ